MKKEHGHDQKASKPLLPTLRSRLLVAMLFAAVPVIGIAVFTVLEMRTAASLDIRESALRLAKVVSRTRSEAGDQKDVVAKSLEELPAGAEWGVIDTTGKVVERVPDKDEYTGTMLPEEDLKNEIISAKQGSFETTGRDGISRLYSFVRFGGADLSERYAYLGIPSTDAFAKTRAVEARLVLVSVLSTLLVVFAALALADLIIVRRVKRNMDALRQIAVGDLGAHKALMYGFGEMDDINTLFDTMVTKLKTAYMNTDQQVRAKTAEWEIKQGLTELEKARDEALLSSIGEGVVYVDSEGRIGLINSAAERIMGFGQDEVMGAPLSSVYRLEDEKKKLIDADKRPANVAMNTGKTVETPMHPKPYYYVRKDKTRFPVHINVRPVSLHGDIIGAIAVFQDVTDEMEFDQRKSEFISIASHQLRSPLSATKWLSDMLRQGDAGKLLPKQQELADKLFEANERMVVMVNDLLNVSRIESGVIKPTLTPTDLTKLVNEVLSDTAPLLIQKKQLLVKNIAKLPPVLADALLTREVFANFISNASKYSPDGGTVTVSLEQKGNEAVVVVKDTGIGIPKKDHGQMFKKFFRAENAAKSTVQGTGLGLYVCKSIIELSGGKIWFDSDEGKGTTFYFTLPMAPAA